MCLNELWVCVSNHLPRLKTPGVHDVREILAEGGMCIEQRFVTVSGPFEQTSLRS